MDVGDLGLATFLTLIAVALLAGWVDAVVGGGGLIQLPSLLIGLPQSTPVPMVSGANKLSSVWGTLIATITYARKVSLPGRTWLPLVVAAAVGSSTGARLVQYLPRELFTPLVLVVLVAVGWYTIRRPALGLHTEMRHDGAGHVLRVTAIGLGVGAYDGLIGPGTGTFFVILLVAVLGYGFLEASALTKLANFTTNLAAIGVFAAHRQLLWGIGLSMGAANLIGGFVGASMAVKHGSGFVRRVFLVVVAALAVKLAHASVTLVLR